MVAFQVDGCLKELTQMLDDRKPDALPMGYARESVS